MNSKIKSAVVYLTSDDVAVNNETVSISTVTTPICVWVFSSDICYLLYFMVCEAIKIPVVSFTASNAMILAGLVLSVMLKKYSPSKIWLQYRKAATLFVPVYVALVVALLFYCAVADSLGLPLHSVYLARIANSLNSINF